MYKDQTRHSGVLVSDQVAIASGACCKTACQEQARDLYWITACMHTSPEVIMLLLQRLADLVCLPVPMSVNGRGVCSH